MDGEFYFSDTLNNPQYYAISYHYTVSQEIKLFILEADHYEMELDPDNWEYGSTITGGKYNEELKGYDNKYIDPIMALHKMPDSPEKTAKLDSLFKVSGDFKKSYIKEHPESPISLCYLSMMSMSAQELNVQLESLSALSYMDMYSGLKASNQMQLTLQAEEAQQTIVDTTSVFKELNVVNHSVLQSLVAAYPDKVLYIDLWGVGCGPCIKEFAYSNKLSEVFKNKDVAFIYLCVGGSSKEEWKKRVTRSCNCGNHYLISDELSKVFVEELGLDLPGTPHYAIIDQNGKLVDNNAMRPSNQKIAAKLNGLLN